MVDPLNRLHTGEILQRTAHAFVDWQPRSIFEQQADELAGVPISRNIRGRIRDAAEEPAQIRLVGPNRDPNLGATQECDRRANAVNGRTIVEIHLQVKSKPLLCSSSNRDDDVPWAALPQMIQQNLI